MVLVVKLLLKMQLLTYFRGTCGQTLVFGLCCIYCHRVLPSVFAATCGQILPFQRFSVLFLEIQLVKVPGPESLVVRSITYPLPYQTGND